ncbi:TerD family protein [Deinococcus sp. HMF7604]|uniref:TerD family protein n=1 Tax=Deinococcus betulae TaxID=2873312 RepID=UPI001CCA0947|nr:TerD family protein [Deinococcus betulae]MBZ9751161.1 TerD family protein [Deinococcus betulae]
MANSLQRGQRLPLISLTTEQSVFLNVQLPGMTDADISLFGLDEQRHLSDDRYFVFYNQPSSPEKSLTLDLQRALVRIDFSRLPLGIHRLLLVATSDHQNFSALGDGLVRLGDAAGVRADFAVKGNMFQAERAVMLLELYRHQGQWRVAAVGQGFNGGLQALLESLGGVVLDEPPLPVPPSPSSAQHPTVPSMQDWAPLRSAPLSAPSGQSCRRCRANSTLMNRLDGQGLCAHCRRQIEEGLRRFRTRFVAACADSVMEYHEWTDLQSVIDQERLSARQALEFVRSDALRLLERMFALARSDGTITPEEEGTFNSLVHLLEVPHTMVQHLRQELSELKQATSIRAGHLPTIHSSLFLEAGEIAHFECTATYRQVTATRIRDIPGRLTVTSRQIHFSSASEGGWNIQYGKVLMIEELPDGVNLSLGVKKGNGSYHHVQQPVLLGATLDALVRINKRLLLMPQTERASRSIPQHVKLEVWQRDQGKCVQCGDSNYLEFDHVIPHSLGGANTANNLQLLCRRCNLAKSNRI